MSAGLSCSTLPPPTALPPPPAVAGVKGNLAEAGLAGVASPGAGVKGSLAEAGLAGVASPGGLVGDGGDGMAGPADDVDGLIGSSSSLYLTGATPLLLLAEVLVIISLVHLFNITEIITYK